MINAIQLRLLRNSEFIRFQKQVLDICDASDPTALKIAAQVTALKEALGPLDDLFVKERGNLITAELEALDARRDAALVGIRLQAESNTYHYNATLKNAGDQVLAAIDKYGRNLARLNYLAETEVIISLVADLNSDARLVTAVQTQDMGDWVTELATANTLFNTRWLARNTDYARQPQGNMLGHREAATEAYRLLSQHIISHATIAPADSYNKLVAEINAMVTQYNQLLSTRNNGNDEDELPGGLDNDALTPQDTV